MGIRRFLFLFSMSIQFLDAKEIIITKSLDLIEEITSQLDCHSLVLLDVDGTLIVPDDAILKPHRQKQFKELIKGHPHRDLFRDIHLKAPHSIVDSASLDFVRRLQAKGIPTIAFTAAPAQARYPGEPGDWRIEELKSFGFDFSQAFPHHPVLEIPKEETQLFYPLFKSGILFSSLHSKGDILVYFLNKLSFVPNKILFIDDCIEYIESVRESLDRSGIEFMGIHYTAAADVPSQLNLDHARFQVDYFLKNDIWLEDKIIGSQISIEE